MKKTQIYFNIMLLLSLVAVLPGCTSGDKSGEKVNEQVTSNTDTSVNNKSTTSDSDKAANTNPDEALLTSNGNVLVSLEEFNKLWNDYIEQKPEVQGSLPQYNYGPYEFYQGQLMIPAILKEWVKRGDKNIAEKYQKQIEQTYKLAELQVLVDIFRDEALSSLDFSDKSLKDLYESQKETLHLFQQPPFLKNSSTVVAQSVEFSDEKAAQDFAEQAKKSDKTFKELAAQDNKVFKDLGTVTDKSEDIDPSAKAEILEMKTGEISVVPTSEDKYLVVKAIKTGAPEYADFDDNIKDAVKQIKLMLEAESAVTKKLEDIKQSLNIKENDAYFKQLQEKQEAEIEQRLKEFEELNKSSQDAEQNSQDQDSQANQYAADNNGPKAA